MGKREPNKMTKLQMTHGITTTYIMKVSSLMRDSQPQNNVNQRKKVRTQAQKINAYSGMIASTHTASSWAEGPTSESALQSLRLHNASEIFTIKSD